MSRPLSRLVVCAVVAAAATASVALAAGHAVAPLSRLEAVTLRLARGVDTPSPQHIATHGATTAHAPHPARSGPSRAVQVPRPVLDASAIPGVGEDLATVTHTCTVARIAGTTATSAAQCAAWDVSGPVNVVLVEAGGTAFDLEHRLPGWRPAAGRWLVAQLDVVGTEHGCAPGPHDTTQQVELRMTKTMRRHFKEVRLTCSDAAGRVTVLAGNAHTDSYDLSCGGDHSVDWDLARDSLVASLLQALPSARVEYRSGAEHVWNGGCGRAVSGDGRVAYVIA